MRIREWPLRVRALGTGAILSIAYFLIALVILHYLRPDYPPARHMISDYAVGPFGWVMTSAFIALSISCLLLGLGLVKSGPQTIPARIGIALLGVVFFGLVITAIFPTDIPGSVETRSGDIHNATFLINVGSLLAATVLLTASFFGCAEWRPVSVLAVLLAGFVVSAFALQFFSLRPGAPYGLANRLFVVALFSWLSLVASRLIVLGGPSAESSRTIA